MLKEIFEQPRSILDTFRGRVLSDYSNLRLGGLFNVLPKLIEAKRIIIIGCGTSWHAGLVGEYLFEDLARLPVEVAMAGSGVLSQQAELDRGDDRDHHEDEVAQRGGVAVVAEAELLVGVHRHRDHRAGWWGRGRGLPGGNGVLRSGRTLGGRATAAQNTW